MWEGTSFFGPHGSGLRRSPAQREGRANARTAGLLPSRKTKRVIRISVVAKSRPIRYNRKNGKTKGADRRMKTRLIAAILLIAVTVSLTGCVNGGNGMEHPYGKS